MIESNDGKDKKIEVPEIREEQEEEENKKNKNEKKTQKGKKKEESREEAIPREDPEEDSVAVFPPNGGWGWVVVFGAFYCNVVADGIQLTFGIFLKAISKEFNSESSEVALAGALMFGIHLIMGPVCAGCNSVFGLRRVTITGSLICCFGVGISYFATNYWILYLTFGIIGGIGLGLVYMNTLVITSLYFTTLMPVAIAVVVSGTGIGTMIFAGMGSYLLSVTTWQYSFLIQAALAGSMSLAAITFKPLKAVRVKISPSSSKKMSIEGQDGGESSTRRRSVFIKTEMPATSSLLSIRTYQNLALSFAEMRPETERKSKSKCCLSRCCKRKKKLTEDRSVLVLTEVRSEEPYMGRKSYVEKYYREEEEEIAFTEGRPSSTSHRVIYTRVDVKKEPKHKFCRTVKKTVIAMLDYRLLSSCSFIIFTVSGAINLAAFLIVYIYEKDRCEEDLGFSEETSVNFIITLGGVNVFWRLLLGGIAIIPKIHCWALAISSMVIAGVATIVSGFNSNIYFQYAFCCIFGLGMASFAVFRMPLLIDLVGMEFLENAAGINLLFMGVFCIAFPPFFGWLREVTNSYNVIFIITGSAIIISSLMLIRLKKVDTNKIKKIKMNCQ